MLTNLKSDDPKKLRVGIIMGGISSEKEVSLESGRNIFSKIDRTKYAPVPVFMDSKAGLWEIPVKLLMRNSTIDIEEDLLEDFFRVLGVMGQPHGQPVNLGLVAADQQLKGLAIPLQNISQQALVRIGPRLGGTGIAHVGLPHAQCRSAREVDR